MKVSHSPVVSHHHQLLFLLLLLVPYALSSEIIVDYVADVGDGWRSTFAVASLLAQPQLTVSHRFVVKCGPAPIWMFASREWCWYERTRMEETLVLNRGATLIQGGDLVYPEPSPETWPRFELPYTLSLARSNVTEQLNAANTLNIPMVDWLSFGRFKTLWLDILSEVLKGERHATSGAMAESQGAFKSADGYNRRLEADNAGKRPQMLFIPGNHDLLDALHEFNLNILEQESMGGWRIPQNRPFFAVEAHSLLILGMHDMIAHDIDREQFVFFSQAVNSTQCKSLALFLHQPFFLMRRREPIVSVYSGRRMQRLMRLVKQRDIRIVLLVFGDMHFEALYAPTDPGREPVVIINGGGGAFAETTAHLPESIAYDLGTGHVMRASLHEHAFATQSEWMLAMLPRHFFQFVHPTIFAFGLFTTAVISIGLYLVAISSSSSSLSSGLLSTDQTPTKTPTTRESRKSRARLYTSPAIMRETEGINISSSASLNFFAAVLVLVSAITGFDVRALLSTILAGLLAVFAKILSRTIEARLGLPLVPSHTPLLLVLLAVIYWLPRQLLEVARIPLFAMSSFFYVSFGIAVVKYLFGKAIAWEDLIKHFCAYRIAGATRRRSFASFYSWLIVEKLLLIASYAFLWASASLIYCMMHPMLVFVLHNLDIAASSVSSLLGLTSYKAFLRMSITPESIRVYHLGMIDVPSIARSLNMAQSTLDGLWYAVVPEFVKAVGLIRTTNIPL